MKHISRAYLDKYLARPTASKTSFLASICTGDTVALFDCDCGNTIEIEDDDCNGNCWECNERIPSIEYVLDQTGTWDLDTSQFA